MAKTPSTVRKSAIMTWRFEGMNPRMLETKLLGFISHQEAHPRKSAK